MDGYTQKVGEDLGNAAVVIANNPDHLNALARIGRLPDVGQELPIITCKTFEVQIIKDISIEDQSAELQHSHEFDQAFRPRHIRAEVDI